MMTDKEIKENLQQYFIIYQPISIENGLVSCSGNVTLNHKIKGEGVPVKFKSVGGWFDCGHNRLTSLVGVPQTVDGYFSCADNQLTSLVGAPQTVGGDFSCHKNQLTSLIGAPQTVGSGFNCSENQLISLVGAPQTVGGDFRCGMNKLTSLVGAPQTVGGDFYCRNNPLSSLTGAPRYIQGKFLLSYAKNLPLLPLLKIRGCNKVAFISITTTTNNDLSEILNRYLGTGTRGMLPCAMEMIKAGYGSNARL